MKARTKIKTKRTLMKRIKITKSGKVMRKFANTGHLKSKWSNARRHRNLGLSVQSNKGSIKTFKKLLGKQARGL